MRLGKLILLFSIALIAANSSAEARKARLFVCMFEGGADRNGYLLGGDLYAPSQYPPKCQAPHRLPFGRGGHFDRDFIFTCGSGDDRRLALQACQIFRGGRKPKATDYTWQFRYDNPGRECGYRSLIVTCESD